MAVKSRSPLIARAAAYVVLRTLKFLRHSILRARVGARNLWYRIRETRSGRALWKTLTFTRHPQEIIQRRRIAAEYATRTSAIMNPTNGYALLPAEASPELTAVLATCQQLFERKEGQLAGVASTDARMTLTAEKREEKRAFLRNLLDNDDLRAHPDLVNFALSDWAMGIATRYLGMVPYLNRVDLLYSVPRPTEGRIASQLFHVDPEGVTQVKFFINVFDTNDDSGPFTFIPADATARILRDIRTLRKKEGRPHVGRYLDDEIAAVGGTSAIISVNGPKGSGVAVDTTRCLHLGSRVQPGSFRLCLYLQYCASLEHGNVFDVERFRDDPIRFMAVKHSSKWEGTGVAAPHQMS
jgi:hypothetical protein